LLLAAQLDEQLGQPASVVCGLANGWLQVEPSGPAAAQLLHEQTEGNNNYIIGNSYM